jgi:hypothetical protein
LPVTAICLRGTGCWWPRLGGLALALGFSTAIMPAHSSDQRLAALARHIVGGTLPPRPPQCCGCAAAQHAASPGTSVTVDAGHPSLAFSHRDSPLRWGRAEWEAVAQRQRAEPLLDMDAVRQLFDRDKFLRDGCLVLPGVVKEPERWAAALRQLQALNDDFARSDWGDWVDWAALGAEPPLQPHGLTPEQQRAAVGNSQSIHSQTVPPELRGTTQHRNMAGELLLRRHSVIPEYFPCGHDPFLMEALTHDDMLALHCMLFGCARASLRFDHCQLFNRPADHRGVTWHSHVAGGRWDAAQGARRGRVSPAEYQRQHNVIFCLCYPDGFHSGDGALKVVPGSHLYREVFNLGEHSDGHTDKRLRSEWLRGKSDACGEALQPKALSLPPGSLVCVFSHVAHAVQPRLSSSMIQAAAGDSSSDRAATRLGCLFCFRDGSEAHDGHPPPASPGREVPPQWARLAADGQLPRTLTELLRGEGISYLGQDGHFGVGDPTAEVVGPEGTFYA